MAEYNLHPHIAILDFEDKPQKGTYISHTKAGTNKRFSNVVLEKPNGVRFRIVALTSDVEDALAVARGEKNYG